MDDSSVSFHACMGVVLGHFWGICNDHPDDNCLHCRTADVLMEQDAVYVLTNLLDWYAAMQDRMSDAERAMFQPVLETANRLLTNR